PVTVYAYMQVKLRFQRPLFLWGITDKRDRLAAEIKRMGVFVHHDLYFARIENQESICSWFHQCGYFCFPVVKTGCQLVKLLRQNKRLIALYIDNDFRIAKTRGYFCATLCSIGMMW